MARQPILHCVQNDNFLLETGRYSCCSGLERRSPPAVPEAQQADQEAQAVAAV